MRRLVLISAILAVASIAHAGTMSLIGGPLADGNGDFNYEGGGTTFPGGVPFGEDIPRDRFFAQTPTPGQGADVDGWTFTRVMYSGGNNAFGLDGNFGFDVDPPNSGSGQAFTNGNENTIVDMDADTISFAGSAGDVFCLSYLLGSDSAGANADVTLVLDAGLGTEQSVSFATQTRTGTSRAGANDVVENYVSTGAYSTVDLKFAMNPVPGSTRSLIDDVRLDVTPIPEPATLGLFGIWGFVLLARRHSRRA